MATRRQAKRSTGRTKPDVPADGGAGSAECVATERADVAPAPVPTGPVVTRVGSALSIRTAAQLADELRVALKAGAVRVDATTVELVDTAGLQLIVATMATAATRGVTFEWTGVSAALREAAQHLGLSDTLRLPATG